MESEDLFGTHTKHKTKSWSPGRRRNGKVKDQGIEDDESKYRTFPALRTGLGNWSPVQSDDTLSTFVRDDEHWGVSQLPTQHSSGSSTFTRAETPPHTPIDPISVRSVMDPIQVVAAPIAGVETMDALVEGMNGFDDDDFYKRPGIGARAGKIRHHPLYHPPLPTPPPGIVLGHVLTGKHSGSTSRPDEEISGVTENYPTEAKQVPVPDSDS